MISCQDLYCISHRLSEITGSSEPFGGFNIIFAGDFAQLLPPIGHENASLYSWTVGMNSTMVSNQEAALGLVYWHQVTTVVILRKNMCQQTQSPQDNMFRQALENMRYKDCTPKDIAFLRTLISSNEPMRKSITDNQFCNVPIITTLNIHKEA